MNELTIEGVIGSDWWGGIGAADVRRELSGKTGDLTVYLNSIGGNVDDGISIFNQLRRYSGNVTFVVDGLAASIASVVLMAADEIRMGVGSQVMIHDPWTVTMGDARDHERAVRALETAKASILDAYSLRVSDRDQLSAWMADETWFSAEAAVAAGFADLVDTGVAAATVRVPKGMFRHAPEDLVDPQLQPPTAWKWQHEARKREIQLRGV